MDGKFIVAIKLITNKQTVYPVTLDYLIYLYPIYLSSSTHTRPTDSGGVNGRLSFPYFET